MSHLNRSLVHVVTRSALPLVVVTCCTVAVSSNGTGFWATPTSEEAQVSSAPPEEAAGVIRRLKAKEAVAREVAAGRLALVDAAARFRDLDEQPPTFHWEEFRRSFGGATDAERLCREVIAVLRGMLAELGETDSPFVSRLEQELQGHLDRGDLRLPPRG